MSKKFHYFAYGSDMSLPQMRGRLLDAEIILDDDARTAAVLPGYQLCFDRPVACHAEIGHANLHPAADARTEGVLYELPETALAVLDRWEGVAGKEAERISVEVESAGLTHTAFAYVAPAGTEKEGLKPSRNHLYRLLSAKRYLGDAYFQGLKTTESLKVAVDDEGMPHGARKKSAQSREPEEKNVARTPSEKKPAARPAPAPAPEPEKKKYYPPVGAYAPKSARAFRKAYGIPQKKQPEQPEKENPWAGRTPRRKDRDPGRDKPW